MNRSTFIDGRLGRLGLLGRRVAIVTAYIVSCFLVGAAMGLITGSGIATGTAESIAGLILIPFVVVDLLQNVKRCHDINLSGWVALVTLIPVLGLVAGIALLVIPGTAGANQYGPQVGSLPENVIGPECVASV